MSRLNTVVQHPADAPEEGYINPAILLAGNPLLQKWAPDCIAGDKIKVGVMGGEPGTNRSIKDGVFEFCYLIEGVIELTEDGCEPKLYHAGDTFYMEPGYKGQWRTIETYKKVYVCVYGLDNPQ